MCSGVVHAYVPGSLPRGLIPVFQACFSRVNLWFCWELGALEKGQREQTCHNKLTTWVFQQTGHCLESRVCVHGEWGLNTPAIGWWLVSQTRPENELSLCCPESTLCAGLHMLACCGGHIKHLWSSACHSTYSLGELALVAGTNCALCAR